MATSAGRTSSNIKTLKALGGTPYTNIFALAARFDANSSNYQLATTISQLQGLPHGQLTTASKVKIASTSANDTVLGTGARVAVLTGLINYQVGEEIVLMNGTNPVETVNSFDKVFELLIIATGSNTDSVTGDLKADGTIFVGTGTFTAGVPSNPILGLDGNYNDFSSRDGIFTIPDGKFGFIRDINLSFDNEQQNSTIALQYAIKVFGFPDNHWFRSPDFFYTENFNYIPEFVGPLPPKADIQLRVRRVTNVDRVGSILMSIELQDLR